MVIFILGTRPEVVKLQPLMESLRRDERRIVWTGQHYTPSLSNGVWLDARMAPDVQFPSVVVGGSEAERLGYQINQCAGYLAEFDRPIDWVVVQGDTTSAAAGAIAAAKLGHRVYHVEAGSRSGDRSQPEELNRIMIDHVASGWAYSYPTDGENLKDEGIAGALWSGEVLADSMCPETAQHRKRKGVIATIHRAETLDNAVALEGVFDFLRQIAVHTEVRVLMHPHLESVLQETEIRTTGLVMTPPLMPRRFREVLCSSEAVVTDSGGVCVEAAYYGVPCVVARDRSELVDLVGLRRIVVGGRTAASLVSAWNMRHPPTGMPKMLEYAWRGDASESIKRALLGEGV